MMAPVVVLLLAIIIRPLSRLLLLTRDGRMGPTCCTSRLAIWAASRAHGRLLSAGRALGASGNLLAQLALLSLNIARSRQSRSMSLSSFSVWIFASR